jgi:hypothetical protein
MNPVADLVRNFQELVAQVPDIVQPFVVALAGAVPFVEGEGATVIGVVGGLHPLVAGVAAAAGNFLCVLVVVLVGSRARAAVVDHRSHRAGATGGTALAEGESKRRQRLRRWLVRFGVPGASILGPLAIPTQFTSAMLVAAGVPRGRVLLWQAVAIVLWTTATTLVVWGVLNALLV